MATNGGSDGGRLAIATVRASPDHAYVRPAGELDVYSAPRLREVVEQLVDDGVRRVSLDLSQVTFVDSQGLGAFMAAHRCIGRVGGLFELKGEQEPVARVLDIVGARRILRFVDFADPPAT